MLGTDDKVRSEISNTPVNMTSSLPLEHIESFRHPMAAVDCPVLSDRTEINNNHPDVTSKRDFPHPLAGYYTHGMSSNENLVYSALHPYKCSGVNNNANVSNNVQKTDTTHSSNTTRDSIEHVPNALSHSLSNYSDSIVPIFYRDSNDLQGKIKLDNEGVSALRESESDASEQPCKRRRLSDPQEDGETIKTEVSPQQTTSVMLAERKHSSNTETALYPTATSGREHAPYIQKTPDPKQTQFFCGSPYYLPFYQPPVYGVSAADSQQVPQVTGSTYLTPSRQSPIMSTYQTPKGRVKQTCQRRLASPAKSENSCDKSFDEDSEVDVINDVKDTSISGETKDSDDSMTSLKSSKLPSPSGSSSTGSPSTISPEDGCRKKTRTNYTPVQVQALEKVFHENPYPDSEKMEQMSKELEIPENKLKVWFQNKRARWRRRMSDTAHQVPRYMGMSPVMSPMSSFGFMGHMGHMMPPPMSPAQVVPGHFVRPGPQTSPSTSQGQKMPSTQVTPPHQTRGHFPQYMPMYPYGMFSPYYYS